MEVQMVSLDKRLPSYLELNPACYESKLFVEKRKV